MEGAYDRSSVAGYGARPHSFMMRALTNSTQEFIMSRINGDKSRFNRERKQKIARRSRNQALLKSEAEGRKAAAAASGTKPKAVAV